MAQPQALEDRLLGDLLNRHPAILEVLDAHGVHFCAGCFLTFFSSVEKAAAFHAVPDLKKLLRDLRQTLAGEPRSNHRAAAR